MIKGILFDKDGTLIEFESMWHSILALVFKELEENLSIQKFEIENLKQISGYTEEGFIPESIIQYLSTREIVDLWVEKLDPEKRREDLFEKIFNIFEVKALLESIDVNLLEGVGEGLKYLHSKGYSMGIATADTKASAIHSLRQAKIFDYFTFIGADDGEMKAKPSVDMADRFCRQVDITSDELLIVGDSVNDYNFAKATRTEFVGIKTDYNKLHQIEDEEIVLVNSLIDMIKVKDL